MEDSKILHPLLPIAYRIQLDISEWLKKLVTQVMEEPRNETLNIEVIQTLATTGSYHHPILVWWIKRGHNITRTQTKCTSVIHSYKPGRFLCRSQSHGEDMATTNVVTWRRNGAWVVRNIIISSLHSSPFFYQCLPLAEPRKEIVDRESWRIVQEISSPWFRAVKESENGFEDKTRLST
jgi:hypothetical protein